MQTQEHTAFLVVKDVELSEHFTDVIAHNGKAVLVAEIQQLFGTPGFVVKSVQIDAGIHSAVQHVSLKSLCIFRVGKNKDLIGDKPLHLKVVLQNRGAHAVGVDLADVLQNQLLSKLDQFLFIAVQAFGIEVVFAWNAPNVPAVNIFQGQGAGQR